MDNILAVSKKLVRRSDLLGRMSRIILNIKWATYLKMKDEITVAMNEEEDLGRREEAVTRLEKVVL
jgi:hypothetical protein